jgi:RNA polymerase sigma-70 factor (ECF subfamily)
MDLKDQFNQIYDAYLDKIYRFIYFRVSSEEIARDLTGLVFFNFWKSLNAGRPEIKNYSAYLYRSARNLLVDYYRRKQLEPLPFSAFKEITDEEVGSSSVEKMEKSADLALIYESLAKIKKEYAEILILYYLNDLSIQELSQIFHKREGTIRVMIHRAIKALKKHLT